MDFSYKTISSIPSVIWYHLKEGNVNWTMTIWSILMHSLTLKGLTVIHQCKPETLLFAFLLWPLTYVHISALAKQRCICCLTRFMLADRAFSMIIIIISLQWLWYHSWCTQALVASLVRSSFHCTSCTHVGQLDGEPNLHLSLVERSPCPSQTLGNHRRSSQRYSRFLLFSHRMASP